MKPSRAAIALALPVIAGGFIATQFNREPAHLTPEPAMKTTGASANGPGPESRLAEVTHNGAKFEVLGSAEWKVPLRAGDSTEIDLRLRITNCGPSSLRFALFDTLDVAIDDSRGEPLRRESARNAIKPGEVLSPPLAPGGSFEVSRRTRLSWLKDQRLRLLGEDGFGGIWHFDGLQPGAAYRVRFVYENSRPATDRGPQLWLGQITTPALGIVIR